MALGQLTSVQLQAGLLHLCMELNTGEDPQSPKWDGTNSRASVYRERSGDSSLPKGGYPWGTSGHKLKQETKS